MWLVSTERSMVMFYVCPLAETTLISSHLRRKAQKRKNLILKQGDKLSHALPYDKEKDELRFRPFCASVCGLLRYLKVAF